MLNKSLSKDAKVLTKSPVLLVILDGFGFSGDNFYNAVYAANKPNIDKWLANYPSTLLKASGKNVGLLPGFIGNSEVGHFTIGCGRVVKQPISVISNAIKDKTFFENEVLCKGLKKIKEGSSRLHIMGLLSDGGVHSHIDHLYAFLIAAKHAGIKEVYVHAFLDGRDVGPKTAAKYLMNLTDFMSKNEIGVLASMHGRFYAMDRDKNWARTLKSYKVLTGDFKKAFGLLASRKAGNLETSVGLWENQLLKSYEDKVTDEFFVPVNLEPKGIVKDGDGVIFFNFRPDRARQIVGCLAGQVENENIKKRIKIPVFIVPVVLDKAINYDLKTDFGLKIMFKKPVIKNSLKEVLAKAGKTMFSIAETEKYAHVTYFFNGGQEIVPKGDNWVMIKSKILDSYASCPKMQASKITDAVLESLEVDPKDFYLINYANADMVGHSGDFDATVKAVECLDYELKRLYRVVVKKLGGTMYITADHGKAEKMYDQKIDQPNTAHTTNPVPFIFVNKSLKGNKISLKLKELADIAPFILKNMGLQVPIDMLEREK